MNRLQINHYDLSRFSKKQLKIYLNELMIKYRDKPDAIIVLHEIYLTVNESWERVKDEKKTEKRN